MLRLISSIFIFAITFIFSFGSPAFRKKMSALQSDGTKIELLFMGDESLHYLMTSDEVPVVADQKGDYCYAIYDDVSGSMISTGVLAHNESLRNELENKRAADFKKQFSESLNVSVSAQRYGIGRKDYACIDGMGVHNIPILLVQFSDVKFTEECDEAFFESHFNGVNFTDAYHQGSVRDYFVNQSDSSFLPHYDILGKVTLSKTKKYYGENGSRDQDKNYNSMAQEAIAQAIENGIDFSSYVVGTNAVPLVAIIYAGEGENVSRKTDDVWPQYLSGWYYRKGLYTFRSVLFVNEIADYGQGMRPDGIGPFCHEFSHTLSLPDMYVYDSFGLDYWDIMDSGQYNNFAMSPIGYSAYERCYIGWLKPDTLEHEKQRVVLAPLNGKEGHRVYYIMNANDATGREFYVLENRQPSAWFPEKYGRGMLIYHINYNEDDWVSNMVNNNTSRPGISIIPADNLLTIHSLAETYDVYKGDLFPGITNNTSLTDYTEPFDVAYKGGFMHVSLNDISLDENNNVVFAFMAEGILSKPADLSITKSENDGYRLSWNSVKNADAYVLKVLDGDKEICCETTVTNMFQLDDLKETGSYKLEVYAIADKYVNSEVVSADLKIEPTAAKNISEEWGNKMVKAYDTNGHFLDKERWSVLYEKLPAGVYVFKYGNKSKTISIK